uniref:Uncharacterized protein n=1 Tax=Arundo donax TaxID=35708 RepID=A0A0A9HI22_ARUDO
MLQGYVNIIYSIIFVRQQLIHGDIFGLKMLNGFRSISQWILFDCLCGNTIKS